MDISKKQNGFMEYLGEVERFYGYLGKVERIYRYLREVKWIYGYLGEKQNGFMDISEKQNGLIDPWKSRMDSWISRKSRMDLWIPWKSRMVSWIYLREVEWIHGDFGGVEEIHGYLGTEDYINDGKNKEACRNTGYVYIQNVSITALLLFTQHQTVIVTNLNGTVEWAYGAVRTEDLHQRWQKHRMYE